MRNPKCAHILVFKIQRITNELNPEEIIVNKFNIESQIHTSPIKIITCAPVFKCGKI